MRRCRSPTLNTVRIQYKLASLFFIIEYTYSAHRSIGLGNQRAGSTAWRSSQWVLAMSPTNRQRFFFMYVGTLPFRVQRWLLQIWQISTTTRRQRWILTLHVVTQNWTSRQLEWWLMVRAGRLCFYCTWIKLNNDWYRRRARMESPRACRSNPICRPRLW